MTFTIPNRRGKSHTVTTQYKAGRDGKDPGHWMTIKQFTLHRVKQCVMQTASMIHPYQKRMFTGHGGQYSMSRIRMHRETQTRLSSGPKKAWRGLISINSAQSSPEGLMMQWVLRTAISWDIRTGPLSIWSEMPGHCQGWPPVMCLHWDRFPVSIKKE